MGLPWYLKPDLFLHKELLDTQESLSRSSIDAEAGIRKQARRIAELEGRVAELEGQLLALEKLLSEQGILPPLPEAPAPETAAPEIPPIGVPVTFPARTDSTVACPRCGKCQLGNRNLCLSCETPFRYENEE